MCDTRRRTPKLGTETDRGPWDRLGHSKWGCQAAAQVQQMSLPADVRQQEVGAVDGRTRSQLHLDRHAIRPLGLS